MVYMQEINLEIYGCLPVPSLYYPLAMFTNTPCDSKGLNPQQTAFAVRKYKSHRRVGGVSKVLEAIRLQEEHSAALVTF